MIYPIEPDNSTVPLEPMQQRLEALEAQLAASHQQLAYYQRIAEIAPNVLYVYDLVEQRNLFATHKLTDLLGYSADEVQRMGDALFATLLYPDDLVVIEESHAKLMQAADGEILELRYRMRHASGNWHWLASCEVVFARDAAGTPIQKFGTVQDVSTEVARESELLMLKAVIEHSPEGIGISNMLGIQVYANPAFKAMLGYGDELIGMPYDSYIKQQDPDSLPMLMTHGIWEGIIPMQRRDGSSLNVINTSFLIRDATGQPQWLSGMIRDITEQQEAEEERRLLREQLIDAQQASLRELSTPLIPLGDKLVVMPLIGSIDSSRAQQVLEQLLSGVAQHHAETAILDITGVPVVDTQVAGALLRAAQAVKLLGAQMIITGIGPEIAQTLVGLGIDLEGIVTRGSLQSGIAYALRR